MTVGAWQGVQHELDRWAYQGLKARFWVRDDDAVELSPQLSQLQAFAERFQLEIGLAVIPAKIQQDLVAALADQGLRFLPMCHGWLHANYGRPGRPEEFGPGRPLAALRRDAEQSYAVFSGYFGQKHAVFVPPFGQIKPALIQHLPQIGFSAISMGPGWSERAALRLVGRAPWAPSIKIRRTSEIPRIDVQIDVIDWKRKTARTPDVVAADLLANLRLRRKRCIPLDDPIGILTHHLVHDKAIWRLCDQLLDMLCQHAATARVTATQLVRSVDTIQAVASCGT